MKVNKLGRVVPTPGAMMNFHKQDRECLVTLSDIKSGDVLLV
jgi:hypothetical protein